MKKVLIINGGQVFAHSGGEFNKTVTNWTSDFFSSRPDTEVQVVDINDEYVPEEEAQKIVWADLVIYHVPVWWFSMPYKLKEYFDLVLTAGHQKGIYENDGRSRKKDNPKLHYGTGGLLQGRQYMLTTSWNAPTEAFTVPNEFFEQHSVDDGVMFGFHKMNQFIGMTRVDGFHFHEMEKSVTAEHIESYQKEYIQHLENTFSK